MTGQAYALAVDAATGGLVMVKCDNCKRVQPNAIRTRPIVKGELWVAPCCLCRHDLGAYAAGEVAA